MFVAQLNIRLTADRSTGNGRTCEETFVSAQFGRIYVSGLTLHFVDENRRGSHRCGHLCHVARAPNVLPRLILVPHTVHLNSVCMLAMPADVRGSAYVVGCSNQTDDFVFLTDLKIFRETLSRRVTPPFSRLYLACRSSGRIAQFERNKAAIHEDVVTAKRQRCNVEHRSHHLLSVRHSKRRDDVRTVRLGCRCLARPHASVLRWIVEARARFDEDFPRMIKLSAHTHRIVLQLGQTI